MENKEFIYIALKLEKKISETILLVNDSLGKNPFDGLDKSLKIVQQRNYFYLNPYNGVKIREEQTK